MTIRRLSALIASGVCLAGAGSASAAPTTYCVNAPACSGTPAASLQAALTSAQGNPDPDRIEIGPGSYFPGPGSFTYAGSATNTLTIVGAGVDQTHIYATSAVLDALSLDYADVSDLEVHGANPSTKLGTAAAIALGHGTGSHLKLTDGVTGALLKDGATLASSQVTGSGADMGTGAGVDSSINAKTAVVDSSIDSPAQGAHVSAGSSISIMRSRIAAQTGLNIGDGGTGHVTDSLLEGPAQGPSSGIYAVGKGDSVQQAVVTGSTIFEPSPGGTGVLAQGQDFSQLNISVTNSAVVAGNWSFFAYAGQGSTIVSVAHSAFDPTTVHGLASFNFGGGNVADAPRFVDPAAHDYHLRPDSPLIDGGTASPVGGLGASDLGGGARSLDGNGDGVVLPDIGAFESPAVATKDTKPPTDQTGDPKPPIVQTDAAPVLSRVTLTHKRFKVRKRATAFRFKLSEDARVTIKIGKRKLVRAAHAGANRAAFDGKIGSRALKHGRYTALVTAHDAAGRASQTRKVSFRIQ